MVEENNMLDTAQTRTAEEGKVPYYMRVIMIVCVVCSITLIIIPVVKKLFANPSDGVYIKKGKDYVFVGVSPDDTENNKFYNVVQCPVCDEKSRPLYNSVIDTTQSIPSAVCEGDELIMFRGKGIAPAELELHKITEKDLYTLNLIVPSKPGSDYADLENYDFTQNKAQYYYSADVKLNKKPLSDYFYKGFLRLESGTEVTLEHTDDTDGPIEIKKSADYPYYIFDEKIAFTLKPAETEEDYYVYDLSAVEPGTYLIKNSGIFIVE